MCFIEEKPENNVINIIFLEGLLCANHTSKPFTYKLIDRANQFYEVGNYYFYFINKKLKLKKLK